MSGARLIAIDDERTPWSLRIALALLLAAGIAWWFWDATPIGPAPQASAAPPSTAGTAATVAPAEAEAPPAATAAAQAAPLVACALQDLRIEPGTPEGAIRACVGATQLHHNGSVRSYEVQGIGPEAWSLRVDTTQGSVLRAVLSSGRGERFSCEAEACAGLVLGAHDLRGARSLRLDQVAFTPAAPRARRSVDALPELADTDAADTTDGAGKADETANAAHRDAAAVPKPAKDSAAAQTLRVSAVLRVPSEAQVPGLACTGPSVQVSAGDASRTTFCALGGAGFELADDGMRRYHFQNGEGAMLQVRVGPDERIARVDFGRFSCAGSACQGVQMQAADAGDELGERSFYFGRTLLREAAGPGVVLDGSIVMPAQR